MLSADGHYTTAIDMWSVGCIFAEVTYGSFPSFNAKRRSLVVALQMLGRNPLFAGKDFMQTIEMQIAILGTIAVPNSIAMSSSHSVCRDSSAGGADVHPVGPGAPVPEQAALQANHPLVPALQRGVGEGSRVRIQLPLLYLARVDR
jgi:serine/threonine protein kinase